MHEHRTRATRSHRRSGTAAVLAECEPGERAAEGGFHVAGGHDGADVLNSRGVVVAPRISGWLVTVANRSGEDQFVTARAVCERV